jgi:hypothetical protein
MSAANLQNSVQKLADDVQAEVKRTTPKVCTFLITPTPRLAML